MSKRFLRSETVRFLRLGKKRPKLQKWRRPRGRHSKIRRKRFSYPIQPGIGYGTPKELRHLVKGKHVLLVRNLKELEKADKNATIVLSRTIGAKKRLEMLKRALELNLNVRGAKK